MQRKFASITALVVIVVIVLGVNLIASLLFQRVKFDVTEGKIFTLAKGSRDIAADLPEHANARFFFSKTGALGNPMLRAYAGRIVDMLREYQAAAKKGHLTLEQIDPRPDTAEEEAAVRAGLQGVQLQGIEGSLYLGLVVRDNDNPEQTVTVPFFDPGRENLLEYEISKALYTVAHPEKKKIGIVSSLPVMGSPEKNSPMMAPQAGAKPWYFAQQLKETFDVVEVAPTATELPKGLDMLLVIHPKKIPQTMEYLIDQFLLGGGSVVAFVDPFCQTDMMLTRQSAGANMQTMMQSQFDSNLPELFKAWGLELVSGEPTAQMGGETDPSPKVVADPNLAESVSTDGGGSDKMIVWLGLGKEQMGSQSIITSELSHLTMVTPGALQRTAEQEGVTADVLVETTPEASTMDSTMLKFGTDPASLRQGFKPGDKKLALAYQLAGKFKTAFPSGKPKADAEGEAAAGGPSLTESKAPGTVIVVADVDMLADQFSVRVQNFFGKQMYSYRNDNLSFLYNSAENLSGSRDLIALRSRGRSQRPFTRVQAMLAKRESQAIEEENKLNQAINDANQQLSELAAGSKDTRVLDQELVKQQRKLRDQQVEARQKLRELNRNIREEVERMGRVLEFADIALMPILVVCVGLGVAIVRVSRRRRRNV